MTKYIFSANVIRKISIAAVTCIFAHNTIAQEPNIYQSGLLELNPGYKGDELGVVVEQVEFDEAVDRAKITISVPLPIHEIDKVSVHTEDRTKLKQHKKFEVVRDLEQGKTGLIIYLGKRPKVPIKINFYDTTE